jgi:hypothetical protein
MKRLEGHIIREFNLSADGYNLEIVTDTHRFKYYAEGDCCANAYLISPEKQDIESIIGKLVVSVISSGVNSEEKGYDVIDTEFYSIKTHFSDLDLELRTEHNGYYGGSLRLSSEETLEK